MTSEEKIEHITNVIDEYRRITSSSVKELTIPESQFFPWDVVPVQDVYIILDKLATEYGIIKWHKPIRDNFTTSSCIKVLLLDGFRKYQQKLLEDKRSRVGNLTAETVLKVYALTLDIYNKLQTSESLTIKLGYRYFRTRTFGFREPDARLYESVKDGLAYLTKKNVICAVKVKESGNSMLHQHIDLTVNDPEFEVLYHRLKERYEQEWKDKENEPKKLASENCSAFNDQQAKLTVNEKTIQLPPGKQEDAFCEAMFEYLPGEPVSWDIVYEKIAGQELSVSLSDNEKKRHRKKVYDAMIRINVRVHKLGIENPLFASTTQAYTRNY